MCLLSFRLSCPDSKRKTTSPIDLTKTPRMCCFSGLSILRLPRPKLYAASLSVSLSGYVWIANVSLFIFLHIQVVSRLILQSLKSKKHIKSRSKQHVEVVWNRMSANASRSGRSDRSYLFSKCLFCHTQGDTQWRHGVQTDGRASKGLFEEQYVGLTI